MKLRASITAITTAAALAGTGAFLLPAASAKTVTRPLTFTSLQQAPVSFSATAGGEVDKDVSKTGKLIGYDIVRFSFNPQTKTVTGGVALMTRDGFLYGTLQPAEHGVTRGTVTGGTGSFKGATGTITGKDLNKSGTKTAVTITYHT